MKILLNNTQEENKLYIAKFYGNIGVIYYDKEDYKNALLNLNKSLEIQIKINENNGENNPDIAETYESIGNVYNS